MKTLTRNSKELRGASGENGSKLPARKQDSESQKTDGFSPILFHRDDWMDLRDPNRISNKAGVAFELLPQVLVKELCDDALDASGAAEFGLLEDNYDAMTFFVADVGPGLDGTDEEIAELYSIRRALASSKMLRLPTRGMLGNGLRVATGVVLISDGRLRVSTRGRTLTLQPQREDGRTAIIAVEPWEGAGTRVEVTLRGSLGRSQAEGLFDWAEEARQLTAGTKYKGKSSPHWYDPAGFWELFRAAGDMRVGALVEKHLEGCSDKVTEVAGELATRACGTLTCAEAANMLKRARAETRPVAAERLGKVGRRDDYFGYGYETGEFDAHGAKIPFVVEAWANRADQPYGVVCVNRTPVCASVFVRRDDGSDYAIFGCRLRHRFAAGRKGAGEFQVLVNIITPYVPLTSSGKDPDLSGMRPEICKALERAIRVAKRTAPKGAVPSQKGIIRARIHEAGARLSGEGNYLFSLRQLFYDLRPFLIRALGREPKYGTFSKIVGEYEDECGDIEHLYRDDRGTLYHPHTRETIALGTRTVSGYQRPAFGFRSLLFCEKEGLFPMLKHAGWPEQFDCALCSSKGFATRAARALVRLLHDSDEPITLFVVHDADGPGTLIFETLQRALAPYGIEVINLGLDPAEGRQMGLVEEPVNRKKDMRVPVAEYIPEDDQEWLQKNRIELNAMTTPQFIAWLTAKFEAYFRSKRVISKVIPPAAVLKNRLKQETRDAIERHVIDEVLKAANIPGQVEAALAKVQPRLDTAANTLVRGLRARLKDAPVSHWTDITKDDASRLALGKNGSRM